MKDIKNKLFSKNVAYTIGMAVTLTGTLMMTAQMFPKLEIAKQENEDIKTITEIKIADTKLLEILEKAKNESEESRNIATISRSSDEERKTQENSEGVSQKIEEDTTELTEEVKYTSIEDVKISKDMDLTVRTGLSKEDFIHLLAKNRYDTSGFFEENAGTIYDLCEKYSINEIFFCGLISAESGWNIASNHRRTHNYISLMVNRKLLQYNSVYEGLEVAAQKLHKNYLTPGGCFYHGKTLSGVKVCFCPSSTWVDLVYGRMKQVLY